MWQSRFVLLVMLNISQIPNELCLAECFIQTSGDCLNQGIGTSIPEYWRRMGGTHDLSYQGGRGGGLTPWRTTCDEVKAGVGVTVMSQIQRQGF